MPRSDNNHDVTEAIYKSVGIMIARAAANKKEGKKFDIDLKQCKSFIKHQIELVSPTVSSKPNDNEVYCYISVVRKGNPHPIHVPISRASITDHTASSHETSETGTPGNTKIEIPSSKHICSLQLELRALKKAELEIYCEISPEAQLGIGVGAAAGGMATGAAVGAVAGMFVPFVGGIIGSIAGSLASGGIRKGAEGVHLVLDSITLTAEDIFKESQSVIGDSANKIVEKGHYIHCIINVPYEVNFDNADINRN